MKFLKILATAVFLTLSTSSHAANVSGIKLDDSIEINSEKFVLNGAGVREKFIFDIYVIALYLPQNQTDANLILATPPANRVLMHFVYNKVDKEKLDDAWEQGFKDNLDSNQLAALKPRLEQLKSMFDDAVKNDVVLLDYTPGRGTQVTINGNIAGTIEGEDFNAALLSVWLGEKPINKKLKNRLLGK